MIIVEMSLISTILFKTLFQNENASGLIDHLNLQDFSRLKSTCREIKKGIEKNCAIEIIAKQILEEESKILPDLINGFKNKIFELYPVVPFLVQYDSTHVVQMAKFLCRKVKMDDDQAPSYREVEFLKNICESSLFVSDSKAVFLLESVFSILDKRFVENVDLLDGILAITRRCSRLPFDRVQSLLSACFDTVIDIHDELDTEEVPSPHLLYKIAKIYIFVAISMSRQNPEDGLNVLVTAFQIPLKHDSPQKIPTFRKIIRACRFMITPKTAHFLEEILQITTKFPLILQIEFLPAVLESMAEVNKGRCGVVIDRIGEIFKDITVSRQRAQTSIRMAKAALYYNVEAFYPWITRARDELVKMKNPKDGEDHTAFDRLEIFISMAKTLRVANPRYASAYLECALNTHLSIKPHLQTVTYLEEIAQIPLPLRSEKVITHLFQLDSGQDGLKILLNFPKAFWKNHTNVLRMYREIKDRIKDHHKGELFQLAFLLNARKGL